MTTSEKQKDVIQDIPVALIEDFRDLWWTRISKELILLGYKKITDPKIVAGTNFTCDQVFDETREEFVYWDSLQETKNFLIVPMENNAVIVLAKDKLLEQGMLSYSWKDKSITHHPTWKDCDMSFVSENDEKTEEFDV